MQSPEFICLLRLSALGDVTHVVPLIRTLQKTWPRATLVWVVGKAEHRLLEGLRGVELIEYDKRSGLRGMLRLRETLSRVLGKRRRFDVLMQMQVSARANLLSLFIPSRIKIGYDKAKSKEAHSLVINRRIPRTGSRHVLDVIGSFCEPLGIQQTQVEWDFPLSAEAQKWAQAQWPVDNSKRPPRAVLTA